MEKERKILIETLPNGRVTASSPKMPRAEYQIGGRINIEGQGYDILLSNSRPDRALAIPEAYRIWLHDPNAKPSQIPFDEIRRLVRSGDEWKLA